MKRKVVIFSGAGISAESGVRTFRDVADGYWEEFKVSEVATPAAFKNNLPVFVDFYNMRKNQMKTVVPNLAHEIAKQMENEFDVTVVTQNVDDLHEKAGSSIIYHLHGTLSKLKSSSEDSNYKKDYIEDLKVGDLCPEGYQLRPDVVLFGEGLPAMHFYKSQLAFYDADVIIICGTSMQVYPAAGLPWTGKDNALIYFIDPNEIEFNVPKDRRPFFYHIQKKATEGMQEVYDDIKEIFC
jgi:NAD-dependent deacetylase